MIVQPSGTFRLFALFFVAAILAACSAQWPGFLKPRPEPIAIINTCPQPKPYPLSFQKQAAKELREYEARIPATATLVKDYKALRGALRDCGKAPAPVAP